MITINDKYTIRKEVNKIITSYNGEDMEQLLEIIKEEIQNRIENGKERST